MSSTALQYDLLNDLEPITMLPSNSRFIVSRNSLPANDLTGLIASRCGAGTAVSVAFRNGTDIPKPGQVRSMPLAEVAASNGFARIALENAQRGGSLMRYRIAKIIAVIAIGVVLLTAAAVAAVPVLRHGASGWWNNPEGLSALPENPLVHYESGGAEYARTVVSLLPAAIARVEAVHGRPFRHPLTVGVYTTPDAFVAATGLGDPRSVGETFLGRVMLSPTLFPRQRARLLAILTHELSHAHLGGWMSQLSDWRLPQWFKEGLGVMVSSGGGAEGVSELQARDAIRRRSYRHRKLWLVFQSWRYQA
jgi:hypothetical protein